MSAVPGLLLLPESSFRRYTGEYAAHDHGHAQVLIGLQGSLQLDLAGRSAFVDTSCALVVPAGMAHAYLADQPATVIVVDAPVDSGLERVQRFAPPAGWREAKTPVDPFTVLEAITGARQLLPRRRLDLAGIDAALAGRLHERWNIARLSALCHLSPQRFHSRFMELAGMTPGAYVRQRRLDEAQRLLRAGLPLDSAALQTGYSSASALAFALKRERSVGARELRRLC